MRGRIGGGIQTSWRSNGRGLANAINFVGGGTKGVGWSSFCAGRDVASEDFDVLASSLDLGT